MRPVILCDLDGTIVDSRPEQRALMNGMITPEELRHRTAEGPRPVQPVIDFLTVAEAHGGRIVYVTGRPVDRANHRMLRVIGAPPGTIFTTPKGDVPQRMKFETARMMATRGRLPETHNRRVITLDDDPVMHWLYGTVTNTSSILIPGWRAEEYDNPITPDLPDPLTLMKD